MDDEEQCDVFRRRFQVPGIQSQHCRAATIILECPVVCKGEVISSVAAGQVLF